MQKRPPKYALRFLRWFCREDYLEEIEGDLVELFEAQYENDPRRAKRSFLWQVMRCFRPDFIKVFDFDNPLAYTGMLKHNFLISYRNFLKNKSSFLINLTGLSTGLACVLLIYLWVHDEMRVDKFHQKDSQLYQIMQHYKFPNEIQTWEQSGGPVAKAIVQEMPEVEAATNSSNDYFRPKGIISHGETYKQIDGLFAQENYFEIFSYPLLEGNAQQVLVDKNSILISESLANNFFGSTAEAIGKSLRWNNQYQDTTFQVSGVFEDIPNHSTEYFEAVIHYNWLIKYDRYAGEWSGGYAKNYIVLKEGTDPEQFNEKIAGYLASKAPGLKPSTTFIKKYSDKYLYGLYEEGNLVGGRIEYVRLFSIIGLLILLIACINFMNLATAQASTKMKEIGVKKVIGASRRALTTQYMIESMLMVFLSTIMAIALAAFLIPQFNQITAKELSLNLTPDLLLVILIFTVATGILAGSYPSFYLSGFKPITVLKGKLNSSTGELWVRKGLVVLQFALSVIFIVSVLVINRQMQYTQTRNLGYERDNVLAFERPNNQGGALNFLSRLKQIPGVLHASNAVIPILSGLDSQGGYFWGEDELEKDHIFQSPMVGYDMIETLGMEVIAGRSFSRAHNDNFNKIILNESAVAMMGLENPVGTFINKEGAGDEIMAREVIGVIKDFQYGSLHKKIEPLILRHRNFGRNILVKIQAGTERNTIKQIEELYREYHPHYALNYTFLDEDYQKLYEAESRVATLSKYFSILAILISCLGLLGLAAFTAERRNKEIGIRKILGASAWGIVRLLTSDFTQMVLIAILFAVPVSYLILRNWLESFAYSIELQWWYFTVAAAATLLIAWATVSFQTFKAANINPAECLRDE